MDSKLLIDAVRFIAENPICTDYQKIVLTVVGEGKCVKDQRMVDYFNTLNPKSGERTLKSFASCWSEMQVSYKSFAPCMRLICRFICDFNAGRIPGSTGKGDWWLLTCPEQKLFLNPPQFNADGTLAKRSASKGKVYQTH